MSDKPSEFEALVDHHVTAAVHAGPTSFDDLVCHLPGIYPTEARQALDRLLTRGSIDQTGHARSVARREIPAQPPRSMGLAIPHPLDYDWRFSDAGLATILGAIDELVDRDDPVICLGAPSIVRRLQLEDQRRPAVLLDANPLPVEVIGTIGERHRAQVCRLGTDALPELSAPVVVIDPPWYVEFFDVFLWAAAHLVATDGYVLVSYPAVGTRPDVLAERDASLAWGSTLGLELQEIRRSAIGYRSPPFERAALDAAGLGGLPGDWRRGDLLILRRDGDPDRMARPGGLGEPDWVPIPAAPTQIRVRAAGTSPTIDPRLTSVVDGDVLSSVSRRDPRRASVDVWTANQRVYGCENTTALFAVACAVANGTDPCAAAEGSAGRSLTSDERAFVGVSADQVRHLVEQETTDLRRYRWLDET